MEYLYKAIKDGQEVKDKIEADSEEVVLKHLKDNGLFPVEISPLKNESIAFVERIFDKVSFNDIVNFTRQLAIMLNAGLTLVDALDILKRQIGKKSLEEMVSKIDEQIKAGSSLSSALRSYPTLFPNLYIALVKSGEASGKLSEILLKLADDLEKKRELRKKLRGALVYPAVVVSAMFIVMFIMVTFVVPKMLSLYKDFNIDLPIYTKILIVISNFCSTFWPLIILAVVGVVFGIRWYLKTPKGKHNFDFIILRVPMVDRIIKMAALVDSTRTLAILVGSGVSILDSLNIVIDTTENSIYKQAFQNVYRKIEKGGASLGNALSEEKVFPPILVQMAIVGENTGHLDDTLSRISKYFEFESEDSVKTITTLIEPAVLILLGLGVAFLVLSIITPIYKLTSSFQ